MKKRTLANLSALSDEHIEVLRRSLKGDTLVPAEEGFEISRPRQTLDWKKPCEVLSHVVR